jgi:hypothetical protein
MSDYGVALAVLSTNPDVGRTMIYSSYRNLIAAPEALDFYRLL